MLGRLAMGAVGALLIGAGCYDVPAPDCGFACGPAEACPADYTCSPLDGRCHRDGAAPDLVCPAATPIDPGAAPYLLGSYPGEGDTIGDLGLRPQLQFSEPVTGASESSIQMFDDDAAAPVSLRVAYRGEFNVAELTLLEPLAAGTPYRIVLGASITDFEGTPLSEAPLTIRFTTAVDEAPRAGTSPLDGELDVPVSTRIVVTFSEAMLGLDTCLGTGNCIELRDASDTPVAGTVIVNSPYEVTWVPAALLTPGATYTASLATTLTDTTGNPVVGAPIRWSFTTFIDVTPPMVTNSAPMPGATDVATSTDIRVTFTEQITNADASSVLVSTGGTPIAGAVTTALGGLEIVFTPDAPLPAGATIDVTLTTAIADLVGLALAAPATFSFATAP